MTTELSRVDARGMKCPWPALRAARAMRDGRSVLVLADDPMARSELAALAQAQGWVFQDRSDDGQGAAYLLVRAE